MRLNGTTVFAVRGAVEVACAAAKVPDQLFEAAVAQISTRQDAEAFHLGCRYRTNAVEALDGQGGYKGWSLGRLDDAHAVRFVLIRRELGDELVVRDAGRRSQACIRLDASADFRSDGRRRTDAAAILGDVEIGFVERQWLDKIGLVTVLCRCLISLCHLGFECERADAAQI